MFPLNSLKTAAANDRQAEIEKCKNELEELDEYFPSWMGNQQVTSSNIDSLLGKLYEKINRIKYDDGEDEESNNSTSGILLEPKVVHAEEQIEHDQCQNQAVDGAACKKLEQTNETLQQISAALVEAYFRLQDKRYESAQECLDRSEYFMGKFCIGERINGFQLLIELLRLHICLYDGSLLLNSSTLVIPSISTLHGKSLAAFFIAKWEVQELFVDQKDLALATLEEIMGLDPKNWIWHYMFVLRKRFERRRQAVTSTTSGPRSCPGDQETYSAIESWNLAPKRYRPKALAMKLQALAETLRFRVSNKSREALDEFKFGEITYASNEECANYILKEIRSGLTRDRKAVEKKDLCFGEYIRYGEILSTILPVEYQDEELAKQCLNGALDLRPDNSKANHRLGIFHMTKKNGDRQKARDFFEQAWEHSKNNTTALLDLINLLLGSSAPEDGVKLKKIFQSIHSKDMGFPESDLEKLAFLEGYYWFREGNVDRAAKIWFSTSSSDKIRLLETKFLNLNHSQKRSLWDPSRTIDWKKIYELINIQSPQGAFVKLGQTVYKLWEKSQSAAVQGQQGYSDERRISPRQGQGSSAYDSAHHQGGRYSWTSETTATAGSVADADDCWRTKPSSSNGSSDMSATATNYSYNNYQPQRGGDQRYSQANRRDSSSTSGYQQQQEQRRSESPESWRR